MLKKSRFLTFMVIPHHYGKKPYSFQLHQITFSLIFALIGAGLIGSALYFFGSYQRENLKAEIKELEELKFKQDRQIQEMTRNLEELNAYSQRVKTLTGISQNESFLTQDIGGQGGPVLYSPGEEFYLIDQLKIPEKRNLGVGELKKGIYLEKQTFRELIEELEEREELFACTPSLCPVNGGYISSGFGWRRDPINKKRRFHYGLDLVARRGTPVMATAAGRVVFVGWDGGFGNKVVVDHGYGYKTAYAHLDRIKVRWGTIVKKGQVIGSLGNTGHSSGPHLHYEVVKNGKRIDPLKYILVKLK